ncbi:GCG_CRPN prefix-to-repeats domain-containing protein [Rhodopseudomonas telluris]|uniref:GCG_CRPN prefix-to-repeats domain-containing protein n=1 Tax=Rhodopseudomonas telluris TaxID=644215 RepID=A0ABV6EZE3_9BRAD
MKMIFAAAAFAAALASASAANAMPVAPLNSSGSADVIQVAQGCGPGWARGPMGRCRPMYRRPPVVVVPPRVVAPRVCPPGYSWRAGRCLRRY